MAKTPTGKDEREAVRHAQEYIRLIALTPSYEMLDQALLQAQNYFKALLDCGLIRLQTYHDLNAQALEWASAWQPPNTTDSA